MLYSKASMNMPANFFRRLLKARFFVVEESKVSIYIFIVVSHNMICGSFVLVFSGYFEEALIRRLQRLLGQAIIFSTNALRSSYASVMRLTVRVVFSLTTPRPRAFLQDQLVRHVGLD
jgi:hypothetical protein